MPSRSIPPSSENLPALSLPAGALPTSDHAHEYDVEDDPPAVEPIGHRIRLGFMAGGPIRRNQLLDSYNPWTEGPEETDPWSRAGRSKPLGVRYAEGTCQRALDRETHFYEHYDNEDILADAPAFLAHRLRSCQDKPNPEAAVREERDRRENWYENLIPWKSLYPVLKQSSFGSLLPSLGGADREALLEENSFVGMVIVDNDTDPTAFAREHNLSPINVYCEGHLTSGEHEAAPLPSEFGIELPAPLLVGKYASDSSYPLVPWTDGLVCTCPYKHDKPWRVCCKHELLAAVVAAGEDSIFLPITSGIDVPHRARRFVSPVIASQHTAQLPEANP